MAINYSNQVQQLLKKNNKFNEILPILKCSCGYFSSIQQSPYEEITCLIHKNLLWRFLDKYITIRINNNHIVISNLNDLSKVKYAEKIAKRLDQLFPEYEITI